MEILYRFSCVSILQFFVNFSCNVDILMLFRDSTMNGA